MFQPALCADIYAMLGLLYNKIQINLPLLRGCLVDKEYQNNKFTLKN